MAVKFISETPLVLTKWLKHFKAEQVGIADRRQLIHYFLNQKNIPNTVMAIIENRFIAADRPFFNVYPRVCESLARTHLALKPESIPKSIIHRMPAISIRLPVNSNEARNAKTDWFIMSVFDGEPLERMKETGLHSLFGCGQGPFLALYCYDGPHIRLSTTPMDSNFEEAERQGVTDQHVIATNMLCRIGLGVMMLAADPDYIKPVLLKSDEGKTTPIEERIARAKNRGVYGFTIGEDIERCPHFRRPHFAIRWTGKGATIPKLVPVRGAVIGKEIMTTVPTGHETIIDPVE
jgi:hypothetical protein